MKRLPILAGLCVAFTITGCSKRVAVDHEQTAESSAEQSTNVVEPPPVPAEPCTDPQPPFIDLGDDGHIIIFGDVHHHHHLHFHEASEPPSVQGDVRVEVELMDERYRRN